MPLFYNRLQALDARAHAALRIRPDANFAFARETNSIPLAADELFVAQAHYPIVFTAGEQPIPVAVVGLHNGRNLFVTGNGDWRADAYIPAYVRRYPFAVAKDAEGGGPPVLAIDESARVLSTSEGTLLFEDGRPSAAARRAFEFCTAVQTPFEVARQFAQALAEADLLVEREAQIRKGAEGIPFVFGGFRIVDEARFNALSDDIYHDWRRRGWIALVHAHLMSLQCWPRIAALAGTAAAPADPQGESDGPQGQVLH
ncbi:MAG: SapC family protein [Steroidobacteraceae bacterium]